jgi:hypothetical protein
MNANGIGEIVPFDNKVFNLSAPPTLSSIGPNVHANFSSASPGKYPISGTFATVTLGRINTMRSNYPCFTAAMAAAVINKSLPEP